MVIYKVRDRKLYNKPAQPIIMIQFSHRFGSPMHYLFEMLTCLSLLHSIYLLIFNLFQTSLITEDLSLFGSFNNTYSAVRTDIIRGRVEWWEVINFSIFYRFHRRLCGIPRSTGWALPSVMSDQICPRTTDTGIDGEFLWSIWIDGEFYDRSEFYESIVLCSICAKGFVPIRLMVDMYSTRPQLILQFRPEVTYL